MTHMQGKVGSGARSTIVCQATGEGVGSFAESSTAPHLIVASVHVSQLSFFLAPIGRDSCWNRERHATLSSSFSLILIRLYHRIRHSGRPLTAIDMEKAGPPPGSVPSTDQQQLAGTSNQIARRPVAQEHDEPLDRQPTPPPYSGPSSPDPLTGVQSLQQAQAELTKAPLRYPGLPKLDYRLYSPPLFKLSSDSTTLSSKAEYLSTNLNALAALMRAQSTVPPKPQIQIKGSRGRRIDFDIKLNLMSLLVPDDERQRMDYIRCVGENEMALRGGPKPSLKPDVGEAGLDGWCRRFVQDSAGIKVFTLERIVANLDSRWLDGQIRSLVASLKYRGAVDVNFLVTHSKVVVQNPDRVNQFFTSVSSMFSGKNKYEVIKAVWPFATTAPGEPGRRCIVQSEEAWWGDWSGPIQYAISQKRHGWVTIEDKLEAIMEGKGADMPLVDWGDDSV